MCHTHAVNRQKHSYRLTRVNLYECFCLFTACVWHIYVHSLYIYTYTHSLWTHIHPYTPIHTHRRSVRVYTLTHIHTHMNTNTMHISGAEHTHTHTLTPALYIFQPQCVCTHTVIDTSTSIFHPQCVHTHAHTHWHECYACIFQAQWLWAQSMETGSGARSSKCN